MSATSYSKSIALLREAAIHAAWSQWSSFGFAMHGAAPGHAVIDPEALVLASLAFDQDERRLDRVVYAWLTSTTRLLSASRLSNLLEEHPESVQERARVLAAGLVASGDSRFKRIAGTARPAKESVRPRGAPAAIAFRERTTLMLKLRLALGVGIKADALACLIGLAPARISVRDVSLRLGYEDRPTRRALEDLHAAGWIASDATSPVSYRVEPAKWEALGGFHKDLQPLWRNWRELYLMVSHLTWWDLSAPRDWSLYVQGSRLRDLMEKLEPILVRSVADRPDWEEPVERWPEAFQAWAVGTERLLRGTA